MIDVEAAVYSAVVDRVMAENEFAKDVIFASAYNPHPPQLPFVSIVETGNATNKSFQDSSDSECFANLLYEVDVFTDSLAGKKQECRRIADAVDRAFIALGFIRSSTSVTRNRNYNSIYQMTLRYRCAVDADGVIYRR